MQQIKLIKMNARRKDTCMGCTKPIAAGDTIYYASSPKTIYCKTCGEKKGQRDASQPSAAVQASIAAQAPLPTKPAAPAVRAVRGHNIPGVKRVVSKAKPMTTGRATAEGCYCSAVGRRCGACEEKSLGGGVL